MSFVGSFVGGFAQLLSFFRDHPEACVSQHAVLQLACAVVQALEGDTAKHWETLSSIEKVGLLSPA